MALNSRFIGCIRSLDYLLSKKNIFQYSIDGSWIFCGEFFKEILICHHLLVYMVKNMIFGSLR
jgi:hypothetical protein